MKTDEPVEAEFDDDGTAIVELLERAERSRRMTSDNKFYATREEIFILMSQLDLDQKPRVELDCGGNWVIEIYYSKMIFIHITSCQAFVGQTIQ